MKQYCFSFLFIFLSVCSFSKEKVKEERLNETYRPQYHFSPGENRMGSPISIIKTDSVYHLFYQWNPFNLSQGFVNWGHASSSDLIQWKHEGISISQPEGVVDSMKLSPWWGSVGQRGNEMFAWVNSWDEGVFMFSNFKNGNWNTKEKVSEQEVFKKCYPFVFWHEKTNKWVMVSYNRTDSTINFLNSPDGLNWNKISTFYFKSGFVSLTELPVEGKPGENQWLLLTESGNYMLGKFDGEKFELLSPIRKYDYGRLIGGAICFSDIKTNHTILVSELKSEQHPDLLSNGQLTFPTELKLREFPTGIELCRQPIGDIKNLYNKTQEWAGKKIYPGINNNILGSVKGETLHIKGIIDLKNCDQFGFIVRGDRDMNGTEINYVVARGQLTMLGNKINYKPIDNKMEFEILIDRSSIELFVDGGRYIISSTFVPDPKSQKYMLYTIGGEIMVDQLEVHQLKSIWRNKGK
jgi:fructan beta-fructosidase